MLTYLHLDVFTDQLFAGNQLAVYLDPPHDLSDAVMQAIAREMAFSETTFVFPPDAPGTDYRVRIFTPASELPMAGHPTIGTAFALAHAGRIRGRSCVNGIWRRCRSDSARSRLAGWGSPGSHG